MIKLQEKFKGLLEKWKALSKGKKATIVSLVTGVIVILVYVGISASRPKYSTLFSELDPKDSGNVVEVLKEKKVNYKIKGNSILVPEQQVAPLRMEVLSKVDFSSGSKGFEIFDNNSMVSTDFENQIKYQKALQGEVERMIKSFEEVKDCKVILKLPEKDTFAIKDNPNKASAAVSVKLKPGAKELKEEQSKTIVSLLTGAVENLSKENVHIAVNGMKLATSNLFKDEKNGASTVKQQEMKTEKEEALKKNVLNMLKPVYGEGVNATVNVDLNFDAVEQESKDYKKGVVVSEHDISTIDKNSNQNNVSSSPIDNNMSNREDNNKNNVNNSEHKESTKNYNVPEVKRKEIQAPGKIQKVTVSVAVDETAGRLDDGSKEKIKSIVASAVGFDEKRGDSISVQGFSFKNGSKDIMDTANEELKNAELKETKTKVQRGIAIAITSIILLMVTFAIYRKLTNNEEEELMDELQEDISSKEPVVFEPIEFETNDENTHIEKEVKKYSQNKPDQVADIIKSWLAEDER